VLLIGFLIKSLRYEIRLMLLEKLLVDYGDEVALLHEEELHEEE
jgi:hypothetical protein